MIKHSSNKISLFSAIALSATAMIGSGWLFSAQLAANLAGNGAFYSWMLTALLVTSVGLCLASVVSIYPVMGATTRSSSLSHNNIFGMPFAFANWFGIMVTIATEAQATTQYTAAALKNDFLIRNEVLTIYGKLMALGILLVYFFINFYGIKLLAKINNVITVLKIFTPIFTIIIFLIAHFDRSNFTLATNSMYSINSTFNAVIGAGLIYAFNGFQMSASFASEIENPKKNVPIAMVLSVLIVMIVYMLLQFAFMGSIPHEYLTQGWSKLNFASPLLNLAMILGVNFLAILLLADSIVSPSGTGYSYLGAASRMFYAMAKEGQMPKWTAKLSPKHHIPRIAIVINIILATVFLWNASNWASLMVIVTGYHIIGYMAAPLSMVALRPKTKILGLIVFSILGVILTTISEKDMYTMNMSITVLMIIYIIIQYRQKMGFKNLALFTAPFICYLWLFNVSNNIYFILCASIIFFLITTSAKYVSICNKLKSSKENLTV